MLHKIFENLLTAYILAILVAQFNFWLLVKYINNYWMDGHELWYKYMVPSRQIRQKKDKKKRGKMDRATV